jgi:hypothetical protein
VEQSWLGCGADFEPDPDGLGFSACPGVPFILGGLNEAPHGRNGGLEDAGGIRHLGEIPS